jgi:hypothetical protein
MSATAAIPTKTSFRIMLPHFSAPDAARGASLHEGSETETYSLLAKHNAIRLHGFYASINHHATACVLLFSVRNLSSRSQEGQYAGEAVLQFSRRTGDFL